MVIYPLVILSAFGLLISIYAFIVKRRMGKDKNYKPLCDISERISCTKAMGSEFGSMFLVPNSVYGIIFYGLMLFLSWMGLIPWVFWLSVISVLGSLFLAYVSFFKLKVVCPLCLMIYIINIAMLLLSM